MKYIDYNINTSMLLFHFYWVAYCKHKMNINIYIILKYLSNSCKLTQTLLNYSAKDTNNFKAFFELRYTRHFFWNLHFLNYFSNSYLSNTEVKWDQRETTLLNLIMTWIIIYSCWRLLCKTWKQLRVIIYISIWYLRLYVYVLLSLQ